MRIYNPITGGFVQIDLKHKEIKKNTKDIEELTARYDEQVINAGNSNAEIVDARGKFKTLGKRQDYVDERLNILQNSARIFKKPFGATFYFGQADDLQGGHHCKTLAECKADVEKVIDYIDDVPITFHISYNETTNKFYIVEPITTMKGLAKWLVEEKGKRVPAIKMYAQKYKEEHVNNYGIPEFHARWKELITEIGTAFQGLGVKYFTIHNEVTYLAGSTVHLPYLLEEIALAKSLGYKVSYDYAGAIHYSLTLDAFKEKLDAHFINIYPNTTNRVGATYDEILYSFKHDQYFDVIDRVRNDYPKADVIINECGVQDNWYALASPEKFDWVEVKSSGGRVPAMYLQALLETTKDLNVDAVWWWYSLNFNFVREVLKKYIRGEN